MRVLFLLILVVGSAIAAGSGPYKPRGWKPIGPAFRLPGEDELKQKLEEKLASSEVVFKEYGPPKLEVLNKQELPEVQTIRTFEQQRRIASYAKNKEEKQESSSDSKEATTAEIPDADLTTLALGEINEDSSVEGSTDLPVEKPENLTDSQPVRITAAQIDNMADLLHLISEQNRENVSLETTEQFKNVEEKSGSLEGFREYGPPGFTEYSPPKEPHGKVFVPFESKQEIDEERKRRSTGGLHLQHQRTLK